MFATVRVTGGDSTADVGIRADSMRTGVRISGPRQKQPAAQASRPRASERWTCPRFCGANRKTCLSGAIVMSRNILHLHLSSGNCTS